MVLLGLSCAFLIAEATLRIFGIGYGNAPLVSDPFLHHVHPRSYSFLVHDPGGEYGGHRVHYDAEGLVSDPEKASRSLGEASEFRVAVLGDSFVEATQVPFKQSFPGRLSATAGTRVSLKNFGTSSYSPIFYIVQWRYWVRHFRPTHVFVLLYSNDVASDAAFYRSAIVGPNGVILGIPGPGKDGLARVFRSSYCVRLLRRVHLQIAWWITNAKKQPVAAMVGGFIEENPDVSEISANLVTDLARQVKASGAEFVLSAVPSKARLLHPDATNNSPEFSEKWRIWSQTNGVEFLDLVPAFKKATLEGRRLFFERDIHFNAEGHALVADLVRKRSPNVFGPLASVRD
jgi:hypothetical protein